MARVVTKDPVKNFACIILQPLRISNSELALPKLATPMDHIENLRQDYLRLAERVRLHLQIHVGDATRYRHLRNDVLDFLNAARQVSS